MRALIAEAIRAKHRLEINYPPGHRVVEPHALGFSKDGHLLLRAFQVEGASESGEPVNWKLFRLDRMKAANDSGEEFSDPRPEYNPDDSAMKGGIIARL
jgi:predicted DNA-binding transcriptional regulator YafY